MVIRPQSSTQSTKVSGIPDHKLCHKSTKPAD